MGLIAETSLESRIAELESFARSLRAGNWTNRASVVNAEGEWVSLDKLAFGQVAARALPTIQLTINQAAWLPVDPVLDVYVTGGRVRIDQSAFLVVGGVNLEISASYGVTGPTAEPSDGGAVRVAPDTEHALIINNTQGISNIMAAGFADLVEELPVGWYRVRTYVRLVGEVQATPGETFGSVTNRRLFATPL